MFSQIKNHSLTKRNIKLMVEIIIGIIGLLGIMLAQIESNHSSIKNRLLDDSLLDSDKTIMSETVTSVVTNIDWLELLF